MLPLAMASQLLQEVHAQVLPSLWVKKGYVTVNYALFNAKLTKGPQF